jgi:hypothetical protein
MLSAELEKKYLTLDIHLDEKGLDFLINELNKLKNSKSKRDHIHFMTPSWGGYELTEERKNPENALVNKVTIYKWE